MKTLVNKIMKNQKTSILAALLLFASNGLFAQKSVSNWKLFNSSKVEAEVVYAEPTSIAIVNYDNYLKTLDFVIESKIELEDWMSDISSWKSGLKNELAVEEELPLEDWMFNFDLPTEIKEPELASEEWMNLTECWK